MTFAWCDSMWHLQALVQPERTTGYSYIDWFLRRTWHWAAHSCQEHTSGGSENENSVFREGNDRDRDRRVPISGWSRGRTQQLIFLSNLTMRLPMPFPVPTSFHLMLYPSPDSAFWDGLAAASSQLAQFFSGQTILILFSFLLLHFCWEQQAFSPIFAVGISFRHGWQVRFVCEAVVGQSLATFEVQLLIVECKDCKVMYKMQPVSYNGHLSACSLPLVSIVRGVSFCVITVQWLPSSSWENRS